MQHIIFTLMLSMFLIQFGVSQINGFSVRGTFAAPTGNFGNVAGTGFGGFVTGLYDFDDKLQLTGTVGLLRFGEQSVGGIFGSDELDYQYLVIPIYSGARYHLTDEGEDMRFYVGGNVGYQIVSLSVKDRQGNSLGSITGSNSVGLVPFGGLLWKNFDARIVYSFLDVDYLGLEFGIVLGRSGN